MGIDLKEVTKEQLTQLMRVNLKEIHNGGHLADASDLAVLAVATVLGLSRDQRGEKVREWRSLACIVLNEAGYCECGVKWEPSRCPFCSRLH